MSSFLVSTIIPHSLSSSSNNPLRQSTNSTHRPPQVGRRVAHHISSEQKQTSPVERSPPDHQTCLSLDRRNVLVGLGGLYGATTATQAIGAPIAPPDLSKCHLATDSVTNENVKCCPPYTSTKIIDFVLPSSKAPLRVRKPAHLYPSDELAKFKDAITKMKELPDDDPWNYWQQATIHCTFCNGSFNQAGSENLLQVHGNWLFLPWHRCYLYFWEKILGKLIDDPTFAIPFWNWDTKAGMKLPEIYWKDESSPLYDSKRNESHYKTMIDYYKGDPYETPTHQNADEVALGNYGRLHKDFMEAALLPPLFMGKPFRAGDKPSSSAGSCENLHGIMHQWVGPPVSPFHNMGNFYTAGRDTVFFGHHANVDRMWDLYTKSRGNKPEFREADWREAAFVFVDENHDVVKIKVKDCLRPEQLRYAYSEEEVPWKNIGRKFKKFNRAAKKRSAGDSMQLVPVSEFGSAPRALKETIRALVARPKTSRSRDEKEASLEVLVIDDIVIPAGTPGKFDVYVAKPIEGLVSPDLGDLAGSYVLVPHEHSGSHNSHGDGRSKAEFQTGITTLLEDIDAEGWDSLVVTLVPRYGDVSIGGIHIELLEVDDGEE